MKKLLNKLLLQIIWLSIRTLMRTYRFRFAPANFTQRAKINSTFIFAIWHEQMIGFLSAHAWTHPYLTMASRSADGDYAAYVSSRMGFTPVRGSSKTRKTSRTEKGGKEASEEYIKKLSEGISGGITVDGPKGPRHSCKMGIAKIAQKSGSPILPGVAIASHAWILNSWDKFKIPKPFSRIDIIYADPIWVESTASDDDLLNICRQVEESLKKLEEQYDQGSKD